MSVCVLLQSLVGSCLLLGCESWSSHRPLSVESNFARRGVVAKTTSGLDRCRCRCSMSNVVLRPSTDPRAFDSLRVGGARVHRYLRDDAESEAAYVMWYHGRDRSFDGLLPPLTTGRIGRATSRNGLVWERTKEGSVSEDATDVALGLNRDSWWGFDTAHVGLGQVLLPMSTPAVMTEGGVYLMYYMGGSHEQTPLSHYSTNNSTNEATMIQGMNMKIGVAVSQDGKSWGRVEGDDPTGAIMAPYNASDPNMKWMTSLRDCNNNRPIQEELYCAWPEVIVNDMSVAGKTTSDNFFMYYSTMLKHSKVKAIACAVSQDGFRWTKSGICLMPDDTNDGLDDGGCARCNVVRNAVYENGSWINAPGYIMFYEGVSNVDGKHRILAATSIDGKVWMKKGLILDVGSTNGATNDDGDGSDWDCNGVGFPHVLRMDDDGTSRMYYSGRGVHTHDTAIGVAKSIGNGLEHEWEREQAEFILTL